jgi:hypothetical protein
MNDLQTSLTPIVEPVEANIDIVAVHGLNPLNAELHAEATWTAGNKLWLRDFLPEKAPRARVLLFGYNSNVAFSTAAAGVREVAENLLNLLQAVRTDSPDRPLIFVCHSLGGIIVKRAIVHAKSDDTYEKIRTSTYSIVFFGTPHRGGNNAGLGNVAAKIVRIVSTNPGNTFMEALRANSLFADSMVDDFRQRLLDYHILSFYETRPYGNLGIVVDKHSATLGLPGSREKQIALDADHSRMCKFESNKDPIYKQVEVNLLEMIRDASSPSEAGPAPSGNVSSTRGDDNITNQAGRRNQSNTEGDSNATNQAGDDNRSTIVGRGNKTTQVEVGPGISLNTIKALWRK